MAKGHSASPIRAEQNVSLGDWYERAAPKAIINFLLCSYENVNIYGCSSNGAAAFTSRTRPKYKLVKLAALPEGRYKVTNTQYEINSIDGAPFTRTRDGRRVTVELEGKKECSV